MMRAVRSQPRVSALVLRSVPLFAMLSEAQRAVLTNVVQWRSFARGSTIIEAGDTTRSLYIIVSGRVQVVMGDDAGDEVILAILRPGEYFGEMGLIDDLPRSASVVAREPCELLTLSKHGFAGCLRENFDLTMAVARGLVKRLRDADTRIGSLALLDVYGRVAQLLLQMAEDVEGRRVITPRLSRLDIAKMIGASREMVGRVMKDLQARGYIEVKGASIVLRDPVFREE